MPRTLLGNPREFPEGQGRSIKLLPGLEAYVFCYQGHVRAFINRCTHMGGPVQFSPEEKQLVCGWHEASFNPQTGERNLGQAPAESCLTKLVIEEDPSGMLWLLWDRPTDPFAF